MAVEKTYLVGFASIGFSDNTADTDYVDPDNRKLYPAKTRPTTWNYHVPAANADEARYNAWKLFLKDFYGDLPNIGKIDESIADIFDMYSNMTNVRPVFCKVLGKGGSGSVGKNDSGESRNVELNANGKRRRRRKTSKAFKARKKRAPRTIDGKAPSITKKDGTVVSTECVTTKTTDEIANE